MGDAAGQFSEGLELFQLSKLLFRAPVVAARLGVGEFSTYGGQEASQITLQNLILRADSHGIDGDVFANRSGHENERHIGIFFADDF